MQIGEQTNMPTRVHDQAELLAGLANLSTSELLRGLEGERVISVAEAARLNGISVDTFMRRFSDKVVKITEKRRGVKLKVALAITQPLNAA
jgi:hypothetical protein